MIKRGQAFGSAYCLFHEQTHLGRLPSRSLACMLTYPRVSCQPTRPVLTKLVVTIHGWKTTRFYGTLMSVALQYRFLSVPGLRSRGLSGRFGLLHPPTLFTRTFFCVVSQILPEQLASRTTSWLEAIGLVNVKTWIFRTPNDAESEYSRTIIRSKVRDTRGRSFTFTLDGVLESPGALPTTVCQWPRHTSSRC